jgi:arylformamidase
MKIIDITLTIHSTLVTWNNDETALERKWFNKISDGDSCNLSQITIGSHCGTHLDAPLHFIDNGSTVDQLDLKDLIGNCLVVELPIDYMGEIEVSHCESLIIPTGTTKLIFKTSNTYRRLLHDPKFHDHFVSLNPSSAQWLVNHGIKTVGVDYLSVGSPSSGKIAETHQIMLGAGLVLLEGLMLDNVEPGNYQLIALPLKIAGAEGCPMRAVLLQE